MSNTVTFNTSKKTTCFRWLQASLKAFDIYRSITDCGNVIQTLGPCLDDLALQQGCCSAACAAGMASISAACHKKIQRQACGSSIEQQVFAVSQRCLGIKPSCKLLTYPAQPENDSGR